MFNILEDFLSTFANLYKSHNSIPEGRQTQLLVLQFYKIWDSHV